MSDRLKGRVAIVTGSGQGIGRTIALAMAQEGAKIVTNARLPRSTIRVGYGGKLLDTLSPQWREFLIKRTTELNGDAETTAKEILKLGGEALAFSGDVSSFEVAHKLIKTAVDNFGRLDILINNAAAIRRAPIWEVTEEDWDVQINSILKGTFNCTRHACPLMKEQGMGRIINFTSTAWLGTSLHHACYSAAKGGIVSFTKSAAVDLYPYGITCNVIAPWATTRGTLSNFAYAMQSAEAGSPVEKKKAIKFIEAAIGSKALPTEAVAQLVVYLATKEATNISGAVFRVQGSRVALYSEPTETKKIDKKKDWWTVDELVERVPKVLLEEYHNLPAASQP